MTNCNHATIPSLDGIRGLSLLIVFSAHAGLSSLLPGGFGVTIFFFLSGYLITTLFYREAQAAGRIDLGAFYLRRLLRLSPPLLVTLLLTYALVGAGLFEGQIAADAVTSQILYYYNYYSAISPGATEGALGLNVLWSLSVEEHFYLFYPFLFILIFLGRANASHIAAMLLAVLAWRVIRYALLGADEGDIYLSTDTRIDSILYGCLLAILTFDKSAGRLFPQDTRRAALLIVAALMVLVFCLVFREPVFRSTLRYSLQGLALMPLFHYAVSRPDMWCFRPLNWPLARLVGFYSYTIYLCHTVVIGNLRASGLGPDDRILFALSAFAICALYALLVNRLIERPVRSLRTRSRSMPLVQELDVQLPIDAGANLPELALAPANASDVLTSKPG